MFKRIVFFLSLLVTAFAQPQCSAESNCVCDDFTVERLKNNNWIVVPWDNGQCYFYNLVTKENRDTFPIFRSENE